MNVNSSSRQDYFNTVRPEVARRYQRNLSENKFIIYRERGQKEQCVMLRTCFVVQLVFTPESGAESSDAAIPHHTVDRGCEEQNNWEI